MWQAYLLTFALAFSVSAALSPICARLGVHLGIVDKPGGRRQHARVTSRLGGIALYAGFILAVLVAQHLSVPRCDPNEPKRLLGLLAGTTVMFVFGLLDDRYELSAGVQYIAEVLAAGVGMMGLIFIEYVNNPLSSSPDAIIRFPWWFTVVFTLFWMTGMMTTVNWLDGLDGLATGVVAIASLVLFANAAFRLRPPQLSISLLPLALAGACLGLLLWNFYPARVFIGSAGAYTLGYALGALSIIGGAKVATVLLVIGAPVLDVAWLIVSRWRSGRKPYVGDRQHLHFRLYDLGLSERTVVLLYYLFCGVFGVLTLLISPRLYKLIALMVLAVFVLAIMWWTTRLQRDRAA